MPTQLPLGSEVGVAAIGGDDDDATFRDGCDNGDDASMDPTLVQRMHKSSKPSQPKRRLSAVDNLAQTIAGTIAKAHMGANTEDDETDATHSLPIGIFSIESQRFRNLFLGPFVSPPCTSLGMAS